MKDNGDIVQFVKQKDYVMINNALGGGSFGKTVLLQDPFIDELLVAKKYEPEYPEIKERFYKNFLDEIKILYKLSHRNIVRIYNYYAHENIFTGYILMEYIAGKRIDEYINEYCPISETASLDEIFVQLIEGFQYIESHGVLHRDIREGNILIDESGTVKIIDFGIGKMPSKPTDCIDSLVDEISRSGSDTLPSEYYDGVYTSKTDMFYLAELFNRLIKGMSNPDWCDFSYQSIIDKMMEKFPDNRYDSFAEIKEVIGKHDFVSLNISEKDKQIYQSFTNAIGNTLCAFLDERKFNYDTNLFLSKMEKVLRDNCFEDVIQSNAELIRCIVTGGYKCNRVKIKCDRVRQFYEWYNKSTPQSQKLILSNMIAKLSMIQMEYSDDLPF